MTLPAEANALMRELTVTDVVLRGKLLSPERSCAELDGTVPLINFSMQGDGDVCAFFHVAQTQPLPQVSSDDYTCPPDFLTPR